MAAQPIQRYCRIRRAQLYFGEFLPPVVSQAYGNACASASCASRTAAEADGEASVLYPLEVVGKVHRRYQPPIGMVLRIASDHVAGFWRPCREIRRRHRHAGHVVALDPRLHLGDLRAAVSLESHHVPEPCTEMVAAIALVQRAHTANAEAVRVKRQRDRFIQQLSAQAKIEDQDLHLFLVKSASR
jgi:hypothetical protein